MIEERSNENREMTVVLSYVKQQAASTFMRFKRITKKKGSIYKSTRERVNSPFVSQIFSSCRGNACTNEMLFFSFFFISDLCLVSIKSNLIPAVKSEYFVPAPSFPHCFI